jgi:ATP-dependent exoDNAse (exonuclease V) beta subunit
MKSPDASVRLRALATRESFVVSAPAGSGKTALLAARYLALLARGGPGGGPCHPRSILCVTFTEKAAVEMQERIGHWLSLAKDPSRRPEKEWDGLLFDLAAEARRAHGDRPEILDNPRVFRIGTFHAFCAQVAHGWPAESGVPAGVAVLAEERQAAALDTAVRRHLRDLAGKPPEDAHRGALERRLAALGNREEILVSRLISLLKKRERLPDVWELLQQGDLAAAEERLIENLRGHFRDRLAPVVAYFQRHNALWDRLHKAFATNNHPKAKRVPSPIPKGRLEDMAMWEEVAGVFLTSAGTPRAMIQTQWGFPAGLPGDLVSFLQGTPPEVAAPLAFLQALELDPATSTGVMALLDYLDLAAGALHSLQPDIPGRGLDFLELEIAARRALGNPDWPSDPLIFYDAALRHALVDEVQDLNPTQVEILGLLLEGWEAGDGRTLFLVGDPKQSIYRFRGSEVSLFEALRSRGVPRRGPGPYAIPPPNRLALTSNFRSHPELVRFGNDLFSKVFPAQWDEETDEVPMGSSEAALDDKGTPASIRIALFPFDNRRKGREGPTASEAREAEAAWIAEEVRRVVRENAGESVGILLHRRTNVGVYARAFSAAAVAVRMVEGEKLGERPEVFHLHNLFRALAGPHDDLAWAGVVRAPWCRVPDAILARLAPSNKVPPGSWRPAVLACEDPSLEAPRAILAQALRDAGREPVAETLLRSWEALGGPAAVASLYGIAGVANCLKTIELLRRCDGLAPSEVLRAAGSLLQEAYTPSDPAAASSPVQLMTVHQAKGLEFDHVFAVGLDYDPFQSNRSEADPILVLPLLAGGERVPMAAVEKDARSREKYLAYEVLRELDKRRQAAEVKRLFYVACTRARRSLTLSGAPSTPPAKKRKGTSAPFAAPRASPLSLFLEASTAGLDRPPIQPEFPKSPAAPSRVPMESPEPSLALRPVPLPYRLVAASQFGGDEAGEPAQGEPREARTTDETARGFGVVLHRVMETLLRGSPLPPPKSVASALLKAGVAGEACDNVAPQLLSEALATWEDRDFVALLHGAEAFPEWPLEFYDGAGAIVSGRLDAVLLRGGEVSVLDFKTSRPRPGESPEDFHREMRTKYGPQMRNYLLALGALPRFAGCVARAYLVFPRIQGQRVLEVLGP